ncbi:Ribose 5-phosphate isomerase B [hydrothermal vent metagenome]|uniref:Ribose 5-phosphate isomerase B n=1 Tax=hydrothermal vent metagenome TaxID=652676 RepID=A0A3B0V3G9_9ZZZZ
MSNANNTYKIYIASDHAGFALKRFLASELIRDSHDLVDFGASKLSSEDDYPDFITPCAERVALARKNGDERVFGIIIGGSGQGEAMAANRIKGVRAAVFYGGVTAFRSIDIKGDKSRDKMDIVRLARLHNDANVLSLGARFVSEKDALEVARLFISTPFSGEMRHLRRIAKF